MSDVNLTVDAEIYKVIVPVGDDYAFAPDDNNRYPYSCLINQDGELEQTGIGSVQEGTVMTIVFEQTSELPTYAYVIAQDDANDAVTTEQVADGVFAFIMPNYDVFIYGE